VNGTDVSLKSNGQNHLCAPGLERPAPVVAGAAVCAGQAELEEVGYQLMAGLQPAGLAFRGCLSGGLSACRQAFASLRPTFPHAPVMVHVLLDGLFPQECSFAQYLSVE